MAESLSPEARARLCSLLTTSVTILVYFLLSIGLTFYQRWFISSFHYPLLVGLCHMALKWTVVWMVRMVCAWWVRRRNSTLAWRDVIRSTVPVGLTSGVDISSSNWSFEYISVSLYTMTKSTSIVFILMFAVLFKLEKKSWSMFGIVVMIAGGLAMFTYKSTAFNLVGFLLVLFASFTSGLRWTLCQFVMQKSELGLDHPVDMMYHLQPWMFISILPFFFAFEGGRLLTQMRSSLDWAPFVHNGFLIVVGGSVALCLELTEYKVVSSLSSLTLSIAAVFKEVIALVIALVLEGRMMSVTNGVGLLMCLGGIVLHVAVKASAPQGPTYVSALPKHHDDATARFLYDDVSSCEEEQESNDDDSEVLFSVLNSRDR